MPIPEILGAIPPDMATHAVNDALQVGSRGRKVLGRLIGEALRAGMVTDEQFYTQKPIEKEEKKDAIPGIFGDLPTQGPLQTQGPDIHAASSAKSTASPESGRYPIIPLVPGSSKRYDFLAALEEKAKAEALRKQRAEEALKEQQRKEAAERQKAEEKERLKQQVPSVVVKSDTFRPHVRRPLGDIRRPGPFVPRDRYGRPLPPPPHMLPLHMRPPGTISPYDMRPDAIRARGWVPMSGPMGTGPGWASPDQPHGIGTPVIYEHNDPRGGIGALRFADPNNPLSRGIRKGPPGPRKS